MTTQNYQYFLRFCKRIINTYAGVQEQPFSKSMKIAAYIQFDRPFFNNQYKTDRDSHASSLKQ